MNFDLRWRFSVMMFLEFLVWGGWFINIGPYLQHLEITSPILSAFFLATLISPFIGGQIADRYMPTQIFMAIAHLLGGVLLLFLATLSTSAAMWWTLFIYSMIYAPTLALSNSICFYHMSDKTQEFGAIRVWGSIGWIVAGLIMTFIWTSVYPYPAEWAALKDVADEAVRQAQQAEYLRAESWLFIMPGIASLIFGVFCFFLPHTPPSTEKTNPWAFVDAFKMMKDVNFAIFMVISFVVSTQLMFVFVSVPNLLENLGMNRQYIPTAQVTQQIMEVLSLFFFMKWLLPKIGIRNCLALAAFCWAVLYGAAGFGKAWEVVLPALPLHGIGYVFFFVVGQMYVDTVAPPQIRASAQGLITVVTIGLGMFFSDHFRLWITGLFTTDGVINYTGVFVVPCILMLVCTAAFLFIFKEPEKVEKP
ncbi:MAG: MFS transporter [bacterium]